MTNPAKMAKTASQAVFLKNFLLNCVLITEFEEKMSITKKMQKIFSETIDKHTRGGGIIVS